MKDPYIDSATGILRNKLGITDAGELAQRETERATIRAVELDKRPIEGRFDRASPRPRDARRNPTRGEVFGPTSISSGSPSSRRRTSARTTTRRQRDARRGRGQATRL